MYTYLTRRKGLDVTYNDVQEAMKLINAYFNIQRQPGMKSLRRPEAIYHGNDYCWSIDGHDKLKAYGIEIYGAVDAYSRRILWFYVGITNGT